MKPEYKHFEFYWIYNRNLNYWCSKYTISIGAFEMININLKTNQFQNSKNLFICQGSDKCCVSEDQVTLEKVLTANQIFGSFNWVFLRSKIFSLNILTN